jgi:transcriptional regulator NrdR family protein
MVCHHPRCGMTAVSSHRSEAKEFSVAAPATHDFNRLSVVPPSPLVPPNSSESRNVQVIRRNGSFSPFDAAKISTAITKAFVAVEGTGAATSRRIQETVEALTQHIVEALSRRADSARAIHIEDIQDQVELALMRSGEHKVARAYVRTAKSARRRGAIGKHRNQRRRNPSSTFAWKMAAPSRSMKRAFSAKSRPPAKVSTASRPRR